MIEPYLAGRPVDHYLFSPAEAEEKRREKLHALRKTPLSCGNRPGTNVSAQPSRTPGDHYTTDSYRRAIARACAAAFPPPAHLARIKVKAKKGTRWEGKAEWKKRLGAERWAELRRWVIPLVRQARVILRVRRGLNRDCHDVAIAAGYAHIRDATDNDRGEPVRHCRAGPL